MKIKNKKKIKRNFVKSTNLKKKEWKKVAIDFKKEGLDPPPPISTKLKRKIEEKKGVDVKLVITKQVTKTDMSPHHGRLTIPVNQVKPGRDDYFLTEEEETVVSNKKHIEVKVIEPCGYENTGMNFSRWKLQSSFSYVLLSKWNNVLKRRNFKVNDVIQVWSFRVGTQLWFAIDKVWDAPSTSNS